MTETALTIHRAEHLMPAMSMGDAGERFSALATFTSKIMREGIDYGVIPGTGNKATLLKPGAEKLTTFFGLAVRYQVVEKTEDWTGKNHDGEPFFYYWFRCQLWRGDLLIAEADGSCNSWEQKYRYRHTDRVCPNCEKNTIKRSKFAPRGRPNDEPGWYCYSKLGGCGATFDANDPTIVNQQAGQVPNPNPADTVNTVQKMAQKRALVAATLLAVNASEYYTQDLEDLPIVEGSFTVAPQTDGPQPTPTMNGASNSRPLDGPTVRTTIRKKAGWQGELRTEGEPITEGQVKGVGGLIADAVKVDGMNQTIMDKARHDILQYLVGVNETRKLTKAEASAIISWLKEDGDGWELNEYARREVQAVMVSLAEEAGRQRMEL